MSLQKALYEHQSVVAVRYPRGAEKISHTMVCSDKRDWVYEKGKGKILAVTYGRITEQVCSGAKGMEDVSILKLIRIVPIPSEVLDIAKSYDRIYFFEEGMKCGGIGQQMMCQLYESGWKGNFSITAIEDEFVKQGSIDNVLKRYQLDAASIRTTIEDGKKSGRKD